MKLKLADHMIQYLWKDSTNHFKARLIYPNKFNAEDQLDEAVNRYVHVWYNYIRPHSIMVD